MSCLNSFTVDARAVDKEGDGTVVPTIINAAGKAIPPHVINNNDGTYRVDYILPEEGKDLSISMKTVTDFELTI